MGPVKGAPQAIRIDESSWPVVIVEIVGLPRDDEFDAMLGAMSRFLARGERFGSLIDLSKADRAPSRQRERMARWLADNDAALVRHTVGTALVITSTLVRGALTAILWLHKPSSPQLVVKTRQEGLDWLKERLAAR